MRNGTGGEGRERQGRKEGSCGGARKWECTKIAPKCSIFDIIGTSLEATAPCHTFKANVATLRNYVRLRDDNGSHFLTRDPRDPSVN